MNPVELDFLGFISSVLKKLKLKHLIILGNSITHDQQLTWKASEKPAEWLDLLPRFDLVISKEGSLPRACKRMHI